MTDIEKFDILKNFIEKNTIIEEGDENDEMLEDTKIYEDIKDGEEMIEKLENDKNNKLIHLGESLTYLNYFLECYKKTEHILTIGDQEDKLIISIDNKIENLNNLIGDLMLEIAEGDKEYARSFLHDI